MSNGFHDVVAGFRRLDPGMELTLTRRFRQPMETVFAALTTPERIEAWMGVDWTGDPGPLRIGSDFSYVMNKSDMPSKGRVTALEPPRLIEHTWFENMPPAMTIRWALTPDGAGCVLTLTQSHAGQDDAPRNGAGWTMLIGQLDAWLDGTPFAPPPGGWRDLRDRYARELGPDAVRDGRLTVEDGRSVVRFKRLLSHPVAETWAWLTEPARLKDWLGDVEVDPRVGGAFHIRFSMAPAEMAGTLTEIQPPTHLAMIWREPWFETEDVILAFDLEPHPQGTLLTLTHTFPADYDPMEYLGGWHEFMDALEEAMGGEPFDWNTPRRKAAFQRLSQVYKAVAGAGG
jgi:uncharacterized protein YndB with AHSA1/START domain